VETILHTPSRDVRHIEHTVDRLLDFACHPDGLPLELTLPPDANIFALKYQLYLPKRIK